MAAIVTALYHVLDLIQLCRKMPGVAGGMCPVVGP